MKPIRSCWVCSFAAVLFSTTTLQADESTRWAIVATADALKTGVADLASWGGQQPEPRVGASGDWGEP